MLNRLALALVADELTGPVLESRGCLFQAGDRVVLLRNTGEREGHVDLDTGRPARLDNGMIGTIGQVDETSLIVQLVNGRRLRVAAGYVYSGHVDHGYATTIHKAQGVTCERMFLVGPAGLYREAVYVAMSRARGGSDLFATSAQVAEIVERSHTTGIPLPVEHVDELDWDVRQAIQDSRAKVLAVSHDRLLQPVANVAAAKPLDWLWERHIELRSITARLRRAGYTDPAHALTRLERARAHRRFLTAGVRVNAADWDNLGTSSR